MRLLPSASKPLSATVAAGVVLTAAVPAALALASGALVGSVQAVIADGLEGPAGRRMWSPSSRWRCCSWPARWPPPPCGWWPTHWVGASTGSCGCGSWAPPPRPPASPTSRIQRSSTRSRWPRGWGTAPVPAALALEEATAAGGSVHEGRRPADGLPREGIRFEGVSFGYRGGRSDVFRDLDLEIPAGRSLAIVGSNGAGKTSLVKLLCRLYDPTAGRILVDGTPLSEIDPRAWQARIAVIFQDFTHYALPWSTTSAWPAPIVDPPSSLPGSFVCERQSVIGAIQVPEREGTLQPQLRIASARRLGRLGLAPSPCPVIHPALLAPDRVRAPSHPVRPRAAV